MDGNTTIMTNSSYLDFPFLIDENTVKWVKSNNVIFIMRGLPGSGKSTIVKSMKNVYGHVDSNKIAVCSADAYFMKNGFYKFDASKLKDAHGECQLQVREAAKLRTNVIVIDNTNILFWEFAPYIKIGRDEGYIPVLVETRTPWRMDANVLQDKNAHGVSKNVLQKKIDIYSSPPPLYFGWFLGNRDSKRLKDGGDKLLNLCYEKCDRFKQDFHPLLSAVNRSSMDEYFKTPRGLGSNENAVLHCTSKYCGRSKHGKCNPNISRYLSDPIVTKSLGLMSRLNITGFTITNRTFGARVQLSDEQIDLYDNGDGNSSMAHITLGIAEGVMPVQTGIDIREVLNMERTGGTKAKYTYLIPKTKFTLQRLDENVWVVDVTARNLSLRSLFSAQY